MERDRWCIK